MAIKNLLLWITGLIVLTIAVFWLGLEEIISSIRHINPGTLAFLFALQVLTLLAAAIQWQFLLKKAKQDLSLGLVMVITLAGNYIESITPAVKLGGEAAKVYLFRQYSSLDYDHLAGIILALKYYSMLPFLCLAFIFSGSAFINFNLPSLALGAFAFLLLFFVVVLMLYFKAGNNPVHGSAMPPSVWCSPLSEKNCNMNILGKGLLSLKKRLDKIRGFVNRAAIFSRSITNRLESLALISLSTLVWVVYPFKVFLVARMLGLEIGLFPIAVITFTAYLVSMVPLSPGGLGSFEATMTMMFSLYGFSPAEGIAVALVSRLVTYWFPLLLSALAAASLTLIKTPEMASNCGKISAHEKRI
jgi:glycosyltransferase 2 family protein